MSKENFPIVSTTGGVILTRNDTEEKDSYSSPSQEVKDIIGKRPIWIVRYGSLIILVVLAVILILANILKYPEIIKTPITLSTIDANIPICSETFGRVSQVLVRNDQIVRKNDVVAYLEGSENYSTLIMLDSVLNKMIVEESTGQLSNVPDLNTIDVKGLGGLVFNYMLLKQTYNNWKRNQPAIKKQIFVQNARIITTNTKNDIQNIKLLEAINESKHKIDEWKQKNVFYAPTNGQVIFVNLKKAEQIVSKGELLFYISQPNSPFYGKMELEQEYLGKLKLGQLVNIDLNNFSSSDYENLKGSIEYISMIPNLNNKYLVKIALAKSLTSSLHKTISMRNGMHAQAIIVVGHFTFFNRIFKGLLKLINRN